MKRIRTVIFVPLLFSHFASLGTVVYATPTRMRSVVYKIVNGKQVSPEDLRKGNLHGVSQSSRLSSSRLSHPSTSGIGGNKPSSRRRACPYTLQPGEAVYKPTFGEDGKRVENTPPRPHLILKVEKSKSRVDFTKLTIVPMSKLQGKKHTVGGNRYMIDPSNPDFIGSNAAFVKLDKASVIYVHNENKQRLLGRIVGPEDLKKIKSKLGIRD